jgi:hypothetical protein
MTISVWRHRLSQGVHLVIPSTDDQLRKKCCGQQGADACVSVAIAGLTERLGRMQTLLDATNANWLSWKHRDFIDPKRVAIAARLTRMTAAPPWFTPEELLKFRN